MEHKIAEQAPVKTLRVNSLYQVSLKCTCGRWFHARGGRTQEGAIRKAEAVFREHIPIR